MKVKNDSLAGNAKNMIMRKILILITAVFLLGQFARPFLCQTTATEKSGLSEQDLEKYVYYFDVEDGKPTGDGARAEFHNNIFKVDTSCVAKLTINLHPTMIDFSQPVKIIFNGKEVFNQKVSPDKSLTAKVFADSADRSLVWASGISIEVER